MMTCKGNCQILSVLLLDTEEITLSVFGTSGDLDLVLPPQSLKHKCIVFITRGRVPHDKEKC